ncbi:MAG: hypothetical protein ACOYJ2_08360, partial [Rickettsiales bacterium]
VLLLEQAINDSGAPSSIHSTAGGFVLQLESNKISDDYKYTYPDKMITETINKMEKTFAQDWERQKDGSWIKMTDDFWQHHTTELLNLEKPQCIIEEATFTDETPDGIPAIKGICMENDVAMNEFAAKVGFNSPVRQPN